MSRPNTSPLMRTQACVCGERHPVKVVLMGTPVVDCVYAAGPGLQLEQNAEFPRAWYLRMRPDEEVATPYPNTAEAAQDHAAAVQAAQDRMTRREDRQRRKTHKNPDSSEA